MQRRQVFEFNDQPWLPEPLRESITEILSRGGRWGRFFDGVAPVFHDFLQKAGSDRVLDLCSGAGEPISVLLDSLSAVGLPLPRVVMSDLFPNRGALARVAARYPDHVFFEPKPVDATRVPPHLARPVRTIINALHHFDEPTVRDIMMDCVRTRASIFVLEAFPRDLVLALRALPALMAAGLANPFLATKHRGTKALLTFAIPATLTLGLFDYFVSVIRVYEGHELERIGTSLTSKDYQWSHGEVTFPLGGKSMYFWGIPIEPKTP